MFQFNVLSIPFADAIVQPVAVMVEALHATVAHIAVPLSFDHFACRTNFTWITLF
jgi:hypothetical protein